MSQIIVPQRRVWTRQPQQPQPLVRAIAEINPIGANFAVDASLQGKPFAKTSQYEPAIRVRQGAKWYFHGETNVSNVYFAEFKAFTLSGEYTVVLEIFGNLYAKHVFLTKGVGGVGGIAITTNTSYIADGSGTLSMQVIHYGVDSYSLPVSSFRPKQAPCTIVITGKANDVAKCWINGVFIGSVAVGDFNADTTSPVRIGRPVGNDDNDKYFYGGISLGFVGGRRIPDALAQELSRNPWQVFRPRAQQTFYSIGAGGDTTNILIADAAHNHTADNVGLSMALALSIQEAAHGHAAESVTLSTNWLLAVQEALHAHVADNLGLSATGSTSLTVQKAIHAHLADALILVTRWLLSIADGSHTHAADGLTLDISNSTWLTAQDSTHSHTADSPELSLATWLAIAEAAHAQTADAPTLSAEETLAIANALHAIYSESPSLNQSVPGATSLTPDDIANIASAVLAALKADPSTLTVPKFLGLK